MPGPVAVIAGSLLLVGAVALALTRVEGAYGPCGSVVSPGWDESVRIADACSQAMWLRRVLVAVSALVGIALCILPVMQRRRGSNEPPPPPHQ